MTHHHTKTPMGKILICPNLHVQRHIEANTELEGAVAVSQERLPNSHSYQLTHLLNGLDESQDTVSWVTVMCEVN
jgi:hypothetical protein